MAKKQQIILTHGNVKPTNVTGLTKGEVLVQHASDPKELALWTLLDDGQTLEAIPSKSYTDNSISVTKTELEGKISAAQNAATTKVVEGTDVNENLTVAESTAEDGSKTYTINLSNVAKADDLATVSGDVATIKSDYLKSEDKTELSNKIAAETSARTEAIESIQNQIDSLGDTYYTEDEIDGFISGITSDIEGVESKVTKLIGEDADKSVRTIANEELAKQLIPSGATEALDTLQEIADWIQQHPEDAAAMNTAITELQGTVTGYSSTNTIKTAIEGIQTQIDNLGNTYATDEELSDAVTELEGKISAAQNAATTKVVEGTDVNENLIIETTTAEDGSTTYTINLSNVAKADALQTVEGKVSTIESDYLTSEDKEELSDAIAAEQKTREENELTVAGSLTSINESLTSVTNRVKAVEDAKPIDTIVVENTENNKITATKSENTYTFNFDNMVIDGGTY